MDTNGVRAPGPSSSDSLCAACGVVYATQASQRAAEQAEADRVQTERDEAAVREKERVQAAEQAKAQEVLRMMQEVRANALVDLDDDLDLGESDGDGDGDGDVDDVSWLMED